MNDYAPEPQVYILDTGGQYTHLISRKVREQGVYAEVRPSETPLAELKNARGIIISGGPSSVYEPGSPTVDPALLASGIPVLGICYGQQLIAYILKGDVRKGDKGEYGFANLDLEPDPGPLLRGVKDHQQVWMSHRDTVYTPPAGFRVLASTDTCSVAAIGNDAARKYAVQFHPEVVHTHEGKKVLRNFLFDICACDRDWEPASRIPVVEQSIREIAGDRNIFFFVSGGVDSTVAYTLCLKALGDQRVHGAYVDTGLMRQDETAFVRKIFASLGAEHFRVVDAQLNFLSALEGVTEPERKRQIIGEKFVQIQEEILESGPYLDGHWILGQGTIYPDTIESGGTAKADLIKTHHNRVAGIQKLIDENRIVEPLTQFYKDEVRELGQELGLPAEFLERHPFPGPGLAIRCLCADKDEACIPAADGFIAPIHSVGVQGDCRSYRPVLIVNHLDHARATEAINADQRVNRVIGEVGHNVPASRQSVIQSSITPDRMDRLRRVDAVVRHISHDSGFDKHVWQFPVVLIPLGAPGLPDSVVLRPIDSVDGMTAQSVSMPDRLLHRMRDALLAVPGIAAVYYDLTHKPPGTIEWE
ncbi:MAG: glutamine-hydrolyzing GMP synthase [Acidobacteria bacterium]|nr:glutamine-hydrolyzing GMP synthase [Acidobacteriota bacterium]